VANCRYTYADVGRFGLGHSLMAWARAAIFAEQQGIPMIAPRWLRLRIGPYLRRERDKRAYFLFFQSSPWAWFQRLWVLVTYRHVPEGSPLPSGRCVKIFANQPVVDQVAEFAAFLPHAEMLRTKLIAMTKPRFRPNRTSDDHVAIHVRLGDFTAKVAASDLRTGTKNASLPVGWYIAVLTGLRKALGYDIQAIIFSDGEDAALKSLLDVPGVTRAPRQPAITDMLAIAQARLLIGSGSGFSLWGAFLGQVPRISYPGQMLASVLQDKAAEVETLDATDLAARFLEIVRSR